MGDVEEVLQRTHLQRDLCAQPVTDVGKTPEGERRSSPKLLVSSGVCCHLVAPRRLRRDAVGGSSLNHHHTTQMRKE